MFVCAAALSFTAIAVDVLKWYSISCNFWMTLEKPMGELPRIALNLLPRVTGLFSASAEYIL